MLKTMPDEFVHCVVTSPPYWGLRDYAIEGQIGFEKTPEEYVAKIVEVFREVKRVLRKDGTLWLNLGDSYAGSMKRMSGDVAYGGPKQMTNKGSIGLPVFDFGRQGQTSTVSQVNRSRATGFHSCKPKDLIGIPWRVAFALHADGWYLRLDIIWAKPNSMPESVTDRPTKAHEYIFLLSKGQKNYFDQEAVREPQTGNTHSRGKGNTPKDAPTGSGIKSNESFNKAMSSYIEVPGGRNIRSVWTIATQPYKESHFATFPEEIPKRCIKAGTSEKGCCPKCGGPWVRVVEKQLFGKAYSATKFDDSTQAGPLFRSRQAYRKQGLEGPPVPTTIDWQPSCSCGEEPIPCVVLDPFMGSGTVAKVAIRLRRNWIGIELNPEYTKLVEKRIRDVQITLGL